MKVLVTGGAGFIGSWVVEQLLREGHEVVVLDNFSTGSRENLAEAALNPRLLEVLDGDVADPAAVASTWRHRPDVCLHLAAQGEVQKTLDDPQAALSQNILGTYVPLMEARRHGTRFVFMSTCMVYASAADGRPMCETSPTRPLSVYAATKLAGEQATIAFHHTYGLSTTVLRPFNTYGPRQRSSQEGGVVAIFLQRAMDGKPMRLYGDGTQTRDFLSVQDCAEFVVRAGLSRELDGEILNGGTGREITVADLARLIGGPRVTLERVPHIHPQCEIHRMICDASQAKRLLGWEPRVRLEDGVEATRRWLAGRAGRVAAAATEGVPT